LLFKKPLKASIEPKIIKGNEIINRIQRNSSALKNNIVKIPNRITKIPPNICHLKVIQAKIKSKSHGRELGIFFKVPLFSEPDISAKAKRQTAINSNIIFKKYIKYNFIFGLGIGL